MNKKQLKKIHEQNAKAIIAIEQKLWELFEKEQERVGKTKADKKTQFRFFQKKLLTIKSCCDDLIGHTNPEIKDNITWYYGKFRK